MCGGRSTGGSGGADRWALGVPTDVAVCDTVAAMSTGSPGEAPTLSSVRTEDVSETLRSKIVRLCIAAHEEQDFENLFSYLPADGLHVLATEAQELVGHAVVTTRWLQPGARRLLRTAYVDAVATSPDHQRRGIGSAVMQYLPTLLTDYEIACLETERREFYRRLGWEEWRGPLGGRSEQGLIPTPDQTGIMILRLPLTPPLELDEQLTIEANPFRIW
jgi:aminoglycoside 2'-N-acetyltransferase I